MSIKGFEVGGVQERYDYTALDNTPANLVQDGNYVHTDNNFTNADKTKLDGIETGANKTIIDATLTQSGQAADAKATGEEIADLKSALDQAPTEETGQELLTEEELNTLYTEYFLKTLDRIFSELPQDESLSGIVDELIEENSWLDQLYREVAAAKT